jgi:hypothetical protein
MRRYRHDPRNTKHELILALHDWSVEYGCKQNLGG